MKTSTLALTIGMLAFGAGAHAQSVLVPSPLQGPGKTVRISTPAGTSTIFAGQLTHTLSGASGADSWLNGARVTYTALPAITPSSGSLVYDVTSIGALYSADANIAAKAAAVERIFNNAQYLAVDPASSPDFAACLQLAVWETMYDYDPGVGAASLSLTAGAFGATKSTGAPLSASFMGIFNSFVGGLDSLPDAGYRVSALGSSTAPEYLAVRQIPAPGAPVVMALAGLVAGRRRR